MRKGHDVWGKSKDLIALIDDARAHGQNVTANNYPWLASNTGLDAALIPRWASDGGPDAMLKRFDDCCPPFRAFVTAISLSFYDRCIRHLSGPKFSAGRNDQMMSIYLPYADQFISAEEKGMQE